MENRLPPDAPSSKELVVLVHGLGANADLWWGSTPAAVRTHPSLRQSTVEFWGYETSHRGIGWVRALKNRFGKGETRQTINQLGEHLRTDLRTWFREVRYDRLNLIGHSMGGLVLAACLGREPEDDLDVLIHKSLKNLVLIASPLGGANLAELGKLVSRVTGGNVHVNDLHEKSVSRKEVVTEFVHRVLREEGLAIRPVIFRASGDSVVKQEELTEPLPDGNYSTEVLHGTHSGCVQNLEANNPNLLKILHAIGHRERARHLADLSMQETSQATTLLEELARQESTRMKETSSKALGKVHRALAQTMRYQKHRRTGGERNADTEDQLSEVWHEAGEHMLPVDEKLANLCFVKGHGWADETVWNEEKFRDLPLKVNEILERLIDRRFL